MTLFGQPLQLHMSAPLAVAIFFTMWWVALFLTLPFGVRSLGETGERSAGSDPGAPVAPKIGVKMLWTTVLTCLAFALLVLYLNFA